MNLAVLIDGETVDEYFASIWQQFFEQSGILLNVKTTSTFNNVFKKFNFKELATGMIPIWTSAYGRCHPFSPTPSELVSCR